MPVSIANHALRGTLPRQAHPMPRRAPRCVCSHGGACPNRLALEGGVPKAGASRTPRTHHARPRRSGRCVCPRMHCAYMGDARACKGHTRSRGIACVLQRHCTHLQGHARLQGVCAHPRSATHAPLQWAPHAHPRGVVQAPARGTRARGMHAHPKSTAPKGSCASRTLQNMTRLVRFTSYVLRSALHVFRFVFHITLHVCAPPMGTVTFPNL